jgi:antitoxin YefM
MIGFPCHKCIWPAPTALQQGGSVGEFGAGDRSCDSGRLRRREMCRSRSTDVVRVKILTHTVAMSDTLPFSEVKAHLSELADRVERQHDRILVTRNGRPSFVLLSPDDLESLEETLDILKDDELMESLRRSRSDAEQGKRLRLQDHV